MITVKLDNSVLDFPLGRQTPESSCKWGEFEFVINQDIEECDYWVVGDRLPRTMSCKCPANHTVFLTGEPASVRPYNPIFLRQFHTVVSCQSNIIHRNVIHTQPSLPWLIGMRWDSKKRGWKKEHTKDYDELKAMIDAPKDRLVSVITSDKVITKGHRTRLEFVRRLEKELKGDLDVFITSNMGLEDKWDAIGRYRYHIALENSTYRDYWSEKIADPILGLSYPIYHGCPNISDYLPIGSYLPIDINDFDRSLSSIKRIIYSDEREKHMDELQEAKRLIMDNYNVFPMLANLLSTLPDASEIKKLTLKPELIIPLNMHLVKVGMHKVFDWMPK